MERKKGLPTGVWSSVIIGLFILLVYSPTFTGDFMLDDKDMIIENPYIRSFHSPMSYLSQEDGVFNYGTKEVHSGYYRPLVNLFYTIDYKIWGMKPLGFRTTNLILHLLTCMVLFLLLKRLTGSLEGALWSVLLFGLHPANTESVSWIAARNNILVTLFCLASLYYYIKSEPEFRLLPYLLSLIFFSAALLSKEFAVMLVPIFFFYNRFLKGKGGMLKKEIVGYVPFVILVALYMGLRKTGTQSIIPQWDAGHFLQGIYFSPFLIMYNLRIILIPYGLHNFIIPSPENALGHEALLGFSGMALAGWLIWRYRKNKKIVFSAFSFITALFPILHIIPTSSVSLVAMRWVYFPLSFVCIFLAFQLGGAIGRPKGPFYKVMLGLLMIYLAGYTYVINGSLWKTEALFFENEVNVFANEFYMGDLARAYHLKGAQEKAVSYYQRAIERNPKKAENYINFAGLLIEMNRPETALSYLNRVEELGLFQKGDRGNLHNNKGAAYLKMGDYSNSIKFFLLASELVPEKIAYLRNLGNVYRHVGRFQEAIIIFEKCLAMGGDALLFKKQLALTYMVMNDYSGALRFLEQIPTKLRGRDPQIREMLQRARQKNNEGL